MWAMAGLAMAQKMRIASEGGKRIPDAKPQFEPLVQRSKSACSLLPAAKPTHHTADPARAPVSPKAAPSDGIVSLFNLTWCSRTTRPAAAPASAPAQQAMPRSKEITDDEGSPVAGNAARDASGAGNDAEAFDDDEEDHEHMRRRGFYGAFRYSSASRAQDAAEKRARASSCGTNSEEEA
eukprot:4912850-Pleurochrysis_carterae.AAC.1